MFLEDAEASNRVVAASDPGEETPEVNLLVLRSSAISNYIQVDTGGPSTVSRYRMSLRVVRKGIFVLSEVC